MKLILRILTIIALTSIQAVGQNKMEIKDFHPIVTDLSAISTDTKKIDQNGEPSAIIKIQTTEKNFSFDVGQIGIVAQVEHKGEIWLYVPKGIIHITVAHDKYGVLRNYYIPNGIDIEAGKVYECKLKTPHIANKSENRESKLQYLSLKVTPAKAIVYIDDKARESDKYGYVNILLHKGEHTYKIVSPNYETEVGFINIIDKKVKLDISLKSLKAKIAILPETSDTKIYIDGKYLGKSRWMGYVSPGPHIITVKKEGYSEIREEVNLKEKEVRSIEIQKLKPIYGTLDISTSPGNAKIYIDGEYQGDSPYLFTELTASKHHIRIKKEGYEPITRIIYIKENSTKEIKEYLKKEKGRSYTSRYSNNKNESRKSNNEIYYSEDGSLNIINNRNKNSSSFSKKGLGINFDAAAIMGTAELDNNKLDNSLGGYFDVQICLGVSDHFVFHGDFIYTKTESEELNIDGADTKEHPYFTEMIYGGGLSIYLTSKVFLSGTVGVGSYKINDNYKSKNATAFQIKFGVDDLFDGLGIFIAATVLNGEFDNGSKLTTNRVTLGFCL